MTTAFRSLPLRFAAAMLATGTLGVAVPAPVWAQDSSASAEARLRKVEAEVRALQRKVFPGGDSRFFEPQIAPGSTPATTPATTGAPATTALTDVLVRIDALEAQLQALTARSEEQANALALIETRLAGLEAAQGQAGPLPIERTAVSAGSLPTAPSTIPSAAANAMSAPAPTARPASSAPAPAPSVAAPAPRPAPTPAPAAAASVAAPSAQRLAAVQAIAKPQTDDPGDDEYSYGFRLWNAGLYPEARQQLTGFVEKYPSHQRISFGRNLLGRAFLDDNLPEEAARWFLRNYQSDKSGDRAADSLLYLGASMIAMNDTKRACIALAEFAETYPLIASGRLANEYQANRAKVTCN
jgi:TolA-binding protein